MESDAGDTRFRMGVGGMTCPSCEHHVEKALSEAGARDVAADFRRGEALLSVNGPPDTPTLANAAQGAGYTPGPIEPVDSISEGELVEYRLGVEGMTCADCERHVSEALRADGAIDVAANFRRGEARFRASAGVDPVRFVAALADTQYRPGAPERVVTEAAPAPRNGPAGGGGRFDQGIVCVL
jgi:mercuric reductase